MREARVTIIGAGFAGAACAYFLGQMGVRNVVLLEREAQAGMHASGKNAGMARQLTPDPTVLPFTAEGIRFLYDPPPEVASQPLIAPVGSIILFDASSPYDALLHEAHRHGIQASLIRPIEWHSRVPYIPTTLAPRAVWTATDGVVDIHAFLTGLIRGAQHHGVEYVPQARVERVHRQKTRIVVTTTAGEVETQAIVNAAGAWASQIAALCDIAQPQFQPLRRHLYMSTRMPHIDPTAPFVWDDRHGWYCRPESGGLLFSACDETLVAPDDDDIDPAIHIRLAELLTQHCPALADTQIARAWSGLRTFGPERRFHMGWDAAMPNLYWLAGLGGHGVTCAAAVGRYAAEQIHRRF